MPSEAQARITFNKPAELDAETLRSLLLRFEAKIQRVLDRVWGTAAEPKGEPQEALLA